jgi:hypothetical protein
MAARRLMAKPLLVNGFGFIALPLFSLTFRLGSLL